MNCKTFMLTYLSGILGYDLVDRDEAYAEFERTEPGGCEQNTPWSDQQYNAWASRLTSIFQWSVSGKDLKEARDAWLAGGAKSKK